MAARCGHADTRSMSRILNIRLDAPSRDHRGGLARFEVELDRQGTPQPIVVRGRVYRYAGEETTREGLHLWAVFTDAGPTSAVAAA
jgi:hypothetical protein